LATRRCSTTVGGQWSASARAACLRKARQSDRHDEHPNIDKRPEARPAYGLAPPITAQFQPPVHSEAQAPSPHKKGPIVAPPTGLEPVWFTAGMQLNQEVTDQPGTEKPPHERPTRRTTTPTPEGRPTPLPPSPTPSRTARATSTPIRWRCGWSRREDGILTQSGRMLRFPAASLKRGKQPTDPQCPSTLPVEQAKGILTAIRAALRLGRGA